MRPPRSFPSPPTAGTIMTQSEAWLDGRPRLDAAKAGRLGLDEGKYAFSRADLPGFPRGTM